MVIVNSRVALLLATSLLCLHFANSAWAGDTLVLNTTVSIPLSNKVGTGVTDLQLKEVFSRAEISMDIEHLPAERALINADKGIDDGTFLRVSGLGKTYKNLIVVSESFMNFDFVAISKNKNFSPNSWESLKPYDLGIITGWKIVENNTGNARSVTKVDNVGQLFQLLDRNRVEIIVYEKLRALVALKNKPVEGAVILDPPLVSKPMFLYMNKKHNNLIPKIVDAIRASKADGTHARLQKKALQPYQ